MQNENLLAASAQEKYFLNTFPLIQRIASRRLSVYCQATVEDITQKVMLKLWSWKTARAGRELSEDEWGRLANIAAQNEIKRFYAGKQQREVPLAEIAENTDFRKLTEIAAEIEIEGNSEIELRSLLGQILKSVLDQSLREKYALLLKRRVLLNHLFSYQCCNIREAAEALDLTKEEFIKIYRSLPLSDADIAALLERNLQEPVTAENVLKARQRAKAKIRKALAGAHSHGKTSVARKA
jgi:DNA-directed RNA polymerase specialized sigma24 family protein